jgi:hypothetical protein
MTESISKITKPVSWTQGVFGSAFRTTSTVEKLNVNQTGKFP